MLCPLCKKFNYSAVKANNKFIEYIRKLKPKDSALALYDEIINDLKQDKSKDRNNELRNLQNDLLKESDRMDSIDLKLMDGEISSEDHQRMKSAIEKRREGINAKLESINPQDSDVGKKLEHAFNVIKNMPEILSSGRVEHKIQLLGLMFPEKIQFVAKNINPIICPLGS